MKTEDKLKIFGYTKEWLDLGILSTDTLEDQLNDYQETNHSCFEHYRCGAFAKWIFDTKEATTEEIEGFIKLALSDPEEGMGLSAIVDLINASWLTDEQFKRIISLETLEQKIPQEINKIYILRELRKDSISGEVFKKCMVSNNSDIQRKLLDHSQITKDMIDELAKNGSSKKIRNIATQLLRSKQYQ